MLPRIAEIIRIDNSAPSKTLIIGIRAANPIVKS